MAEQMTSRDARADAKAAKARAKAMRPWYRKKRFWLLGAAALIVILAIAAQSGSDDSSKTSSSTGASSTTAAGVSQGVGSKDATADVQVGALNPPDVLGYRAPDVKITNNSSKRSNYYIQLSLESPDGKTQYDTATATASNVEPGQTTTGNVLPFTKAKTAPADAVVKVKTVSRTAA